MFTVIDMHTLTATIYSVHISRFLYPGKNNCKISIKMKQILITGCQEHKEERND